MSDPRNQVAVVTGGGRGMGRAIARALAERGATVFAVARTRADVEATAAGVDGPGKIIAHPADVSQPEAVEQLFERVAADAGAVDILICSHGIYQGGAEAISLSLHQFDRTMQVNVRACLQCAQLAARSMRDGSRGGRIVFISSMNGQASQTGALDYDTSKAALNGLTRALAVEFAAYQVTVNAIAPGWVRTAMSESELAELDRDGMVMNPLHRVGETKDIALAALWLTHPDNGFTTGTVIPVDGGQLAMLARPWRAGSPTA